MAIFGTHALLYTSEPEQVRAIFRDVFGFPHVDAGDGWLIFDLPEADMGVHPADPDHPGGAAGTHNVSFYCDDVAKTVAELKAKAQSGAALNYATLGEGDRNTGWVIRLYLNPLAPWIWLGAALCAFGGFVSLSDRRLRVGAPSRRPAVQAAE